MIDCWFLNKFLNLLSYERELQKGQLTEELYIQGKRLGYPDATIARLSGCPVTFPRKTTYKMVDTCAGEFAAHTPYFYATYDTEASGGEDEAWSSSARTGTSPRCWCWAPAPSASARASSSTTPASTASWPCRSWAMRWSSSTTTRRPCPPTSTPPTGCTSSPCPPRTCWTLSPSRSPSAWWWPSAARRPSSSPRPWPRTTSRFWAPPPTPSTWPRTGSASTSCWSGPASSGPRATPS